MSKKSTDKIFSIEMNKDHLSQSLQQYLRTFGYLTEDDEYFDVSSVKFLAGNMVEVTGGVNTDG